MPWCPSRPMAAGRALRGRYLRRGPVRRRRARRTPRRDPPEALPARGGERDRAVERHHPVGSPRRRRGDRPAALRHSGPVAGETGRAAWLAGAAVAVQPLVLLALPVLLAVITLRRWPGFLARTAAPGVLLLAVAAAANWTATIHAVTSQPNSPTIDHPTPWIYLAPHLAGDEVAAGPARILAIVAACGCGLSPPIAGGRSGWPQRARPGSGARRPGQSCCGGRRWRWPCARCSSR